MNELIPITYQNDRPAVSARELHEFLEVGTRFNDWFARMKEYGFSEGTDFYSFLSKTTEQGGRPATDYVLTLDMAKELCMIQRPRHNLLRTVPAFLNKFLDGESQ